MKNSVCKFRSNERLKRACDLGLVLLFLPLLLGMIVILVAANPIFNPGPLFFKQTRMGRFERPFEIFKFRTMAPGGEKTAFATSENSRISPFSAWLRACHCDELPQIWNVFKGEMSFVGPRPEQLAFHAEFAKEIPCYRVRLLVKPGITGLGQVFHGYSDTELKIRERARCDFIYIQNK